MGIVLARGLLGSFLLLVAGLTYARVSQPSWVTSFAPLMAIRQAPWATDAGLVTAFVGLALLTWAWWSLRALAVGRPEGVQRARLAATVWSLPLMLAPPLFSGDGWSYGATGYLAGHGLSPYVWTPSVLPPLMQSGVNARWLHTPTPYGPLAVEWGALASRVTGDHPWELLVAYRLLAVAGLVLIAWAAPRLARRCGRDPGEASWAAVASPFVMAHGIGGLHNDLVVAGLMLAALAVTRREHWWLGAVLTGAAAAVKVPGGMIALGVVLLSTGAASTLGERLRRTAAVGGVAAATVGALGWVSGLGIGWVPALLVPLKEGSQLSVSQLTGGLVRRLIELAPGGASMDAALQPVRLTEDAGALVVLLVAVWLLVRSPSGGEHGALVATTAMMTAVTILSPVDHYWYAFWCLPLLACVRLPRPQTATVYAAITVLGLTAMADVSLDVPWLAPIATVLILLVPIATWSVVASRVSPASPETADLLV